MDRVKLDQHWVERRARYGGLQISDYQHFIEKASSKLGPGGIVVVTSARPDEMRVEELYKTARRRGRAREIDQGVYQDINKDVYVVKGQELNVGPKSRKICLDVWGLPFGENIRDDSREQVVEDSYKKGAIIGLNLPKCLEAVMTPNRDDPSFSCRFFEDMDFIVYYCGASAIWGNNKDVGKIYEHRKIENKFPKTTVAGMRDVMYGSFITGKMNKIGAFNISGGHRMPTYWMQSIGSSYTKIPKPSDENFLNDLREAAHNAKPEDGKGRPIIFETLLRHYPKMIWDKMRGDR